MRNRNRSSSNLRTAAASNRSNWRKPLLPALQETLPTLLLAVNMDVFGCFARLSTHPARPSRVRIIVWRTGSLQHRPDSQPPVCARRLSRRRLATLRAAAGFPSEHDQPGAVPLLPQLRAGRGGAAARPPPSAVNRAGGNHHEGVQAVSELLRHWLRTHPPGTFVATQLSRLAVTRIRVSS